MKNLPEKRYYTIREVADKFSFDVSKIRYWTDSFPSLKTKIKRSRGGDRLYTKLDVAQLEMIYDLVENRGYTLRGARKYIENKEYRQETNTQLIDSLHQLRKFLVEIRDALPQPAASEPAAPRRVMAGSQAR